jgi:chromosomal replication initiator protein
MVHVRNLAMYLARRLTGRSLDAIGAALGGRDHTTVMRGIRSVETRRQTDAAFAGDLENLVSEVSSPRGRRPACRRAQA